MSKLYFFRHAQASYLSNNYDQLSPKGEQQSEELGKYLVGKNMTFDRIFVGPLARQKHTFEIVKDLFLKAGKQLPEAVVLDGLKEHSGPEAVRFGVQKLMESDPDVQKWVTDMQSDSKLMKRNNLLIFQRFMNDWATGRIKVPEVESWAEFRTQTRRGLTTILEKTGKGETIGVFTSGGTISSITAEALNLTDEEQVAAMNFSVRNTSFSSFLYSKNNFNLLSFNELPHLPEEMITFV